MKAGRFYFKQTSNGNLIGEFSNEDTNRSYTESADIIDPNKSIEGDYVGVYDSTWNEDEACHATLEIKQKHKGIYSLTWVCDGNFEGTNSQGEGMLCDDILVGNYWSLE